jgi:hypothetical protein
MAEARKIIHVGGNETKQSTKFVRESRTSKKWLLLSGFLLIKRMGIH